MRAIITEQLELTADKDELLLTPAAGINKKIIKNINVVILVIVIRSIFILTLTKLNNKIHVKTNFVFVMFLQ